MTETAQGYYIQRAVMLVINSVLCLLFIYNILTEKKSYSKKTGLVKRNMPYVTRRLSLFLAVVNNVASVDSSTYLDVYPACFVRTLGFTLGQTLSVIAFVWGYYIFKSSYHVVMKDANDFKHKTIIAISIAFTSFVGLIGTFLTCDGGDPQYYLLSLCAGTALGVSLIIYVSANVYRLNKLLSDYIKQSAFDSEKLALSLLKVRKFFCLILVVGVILVIRTSIRIHETASYTAKEKAEVVEEPFGPRDKFQFNDLLFTTAVAAANILLLWYVWNKKEKKEKVTEVNTSSSTSQIPPIPLKQSTSTRSSNPGCSV